MQLLYRFGVQCYGILLRLAAAYHPKARLWVAGRRGWQERIKNRLSVDRPTVWFHTASLGEFEQGRPIMEAFREKHPKYQILVTFFSPSGYEVRKNYKGVDHLDYLPLDSVQNARAFLDLVRPTVAVFVKYEFWFDYLATLHQRKIPILYLAASFRPSQHFFQWYGGWFRKQLEQIEHFLVQTEESITLLKQVGIGQASVSGDPRYDRVYQTAQAMEPLDGFESFVEGHQVLILGSSWPEEEALLMMWERPADWKVVVAPHEINEERIATLEKALEGSVVRYFQSSPQEIAAADILILDGVGLLARAYRYGNLALVGGAFSKGLHNILEPATFGLPVIFGPKFKRYPEAGQLIARGGGFSVSDSETFNKQMDALITNQVAFQKAGDAAKDFIYSNRGATEKSMEVLLRLLPA